MFWVFFFEIFNQFWKPKSIDKAFSSEIRYFKGRFHLLLYQIKSNRKSELVRSRTSRLISILLYRLS